MCPACSQALDCQEHGTSFQQHIDSIPIPILLVDTNHAVVAMNAKARELQGSEPEAGEIFSFGTVFDCVHSRLPEGCGRSIHCLGCVIRRSVTEAFRTGEPQIAAPATVSVESGNQLSDVAFNVSTAKRGELIVMRISHV